MITAIDSFYLAFRNRMKNTVNAQRELGGMMEAADWPPKTVIFDAFYLLILGGAPLGKKAYSAAAPIYILTVQFQWVNKGTDLNNYNDVIGRSRGDRFRVSEIMKNELLQALYPNFTQKQDVELNPDNTLNITPDVDSIIWTQPVFSSRQDRESGLNYVTATCRITDFTKTIAA